MPTRFKAARARNWRRPDRQVEARQRQEDRDSLTPSQQLAALDERLGKGQGALRERKRLKALIEQEYIDTKKASLKKLQK